MNFWQICFDLYETLIFSILFQMFFHGNKMESLHKHIDPNYLPEDYGGKLPKVNYSSVEWYPIIRALDDNIRGLFQLNIL